MEVEPFTDSISTMQKISKESLYYLDWGQIISSSKLLIYVFSQGHAGVKCNEWSYSLAGTAAIDNNITTDPPTVIKCASEQMRHGKQTWILLIHTFTPYGQGCQTMKRRTATTEELPAGGTINPWWKQSVSKPRSREVTLVLREEQAGLKQLQRWRQVLTIQIL